MCPNTGCSQASVGAASSNVGKRLSDCSWDSSSWTAWPVSMAVELATARRMRRRSTTGAADSRSGTGDRVLESMSHYTARHAEVSDFKCFDTPFRGFQAVSASACLPARRKATASVSACVTSLVDRRKTRMLSNEASAFRFMFFETPARSSAICAL